MSARLLIEPIEAMRKRCLERDFEKAQLLVEQTRRDLNELNSSRVIVKWIR